MSILRVDTLVPFTNGSTTITLDALLNATSSYALTASNATTASYIVGANVVGTVASASYASDSRPYKVYTALLTQNGASNLLQITQGDLAVIGRTYTITTTGDSDFTVIGALNNNLGTSFVATGTTPNWNNSPGILEYDEGAPVVTVLENTIGNVQWYRDGSGYYYVYSDDGLFTSGKTFVTVSHSNYNYDGTTPYYLDSTNYIFVMTLNNTWTYIDNILSNTPIEIRVYN